MAQQDNPERPKPFSKERIKATVSMIIYFYSVFFIIMKIIAIFQGANWKVHGLIAVPFLFFAYFGNKMQRSQKFSWLYVGAGVIVISALRYYELDLAAYLEGAL